MQFIYCIMIVLAVTVAIVTALSHILSSLDENYNPLENNLYEKDLLSALLQLLMNGRRHHVQNFLDVIHRKSDEEFKEDFRLNHMIVNKLIESFKASRFMPTNEFGKERKSAELCLLVTLWFLSNKEPHRTLSNLFDISLSLVFRIIRRIIVDLHDASDS
ncbi:uncharacterized protein LOC105432689 [Pogonomyrmex barbatus]|uniref:Uncharacterized protein LOC105432689 n=1 Tax=Pogonomyrmex barbatus TaxID=144034 RepID=A0A6I9WRR5_9HYME|nr:uncharacterized protein LOC105432689 [Pogonomyrmex barbatus]XP_025075443.1 uncharacterized protein LOC105432689 [Pogonomyrmex barbatus]